MVVSGSAFLEHLNQKVFNPAEHLPKLYLRYASMVSVHLFRAPICFAEIAVIDVHRLILPDVLERKVLVDWTAVGANLAQLGPRDCAKIVLRMGKLEDKPDFALTVNILKASGLAFKRIELSHIYLLDEMDLRLLALVCKEISLFDCIVAPKSQLVQQTSTKQ